MRQIDDDLPILDVGEWAIEKHIRLRRYVDITRHARRKYTQGLGGATYIDLFCGPGRARVRETRQLIDGSPLIAFRTAVDGKVPFSEIHLADIEPAYCSAAVQRIEAAGGLAFGHVGSVEETARAIVAKLNPNGLHFAFLDPFNLGNLKFEAIRTLATLRRVDLLLHVSVQDLQRNADRYTDAEHTEFDAFAPGWRSCVDIRQALPSFRADLLGYWGTLVRDLGFSYRGVELVAGAHRQRLYWLVFLSRHEIANDFWDKIRHISGQGSLDL